jgi:hypothetical protein
MSCFELSELPTNGVVNHFNGRGLVMGFCLMMPFGALLDFIFTGFVLEVWLDGLVFHPGDVRGLNCYMC